MSRDEGTPETVDDLCQEVESTTEFVDKVSGAEIARKLLGQIERLQMPGDTRGDH